MADPRFPTPLRIVAFGDLNAGPWGIAMDGTIAIAPPDGAAGGIPSTLHVASPEGEWRLSGESSELTVSPLGPPARYLASEGLHQLCRVEGRVGGERGEPAVNCLGVRAAHDQLDPTTGSLRAAYAWFSAEDALALTALRPRGATGHDRDAVTAAVFEDGSALQVEDPRLSTTYAEDGSPARAGLELWIESEDGAAEFPRRAAAQARGGAVTLGLQGLQASAYALRWQSRGQEGAGMYLLARPG